MNPQTIGLTELRIRVAKRAGIKFGQRGGSIFREVHDQESVPAG